MDELRLPEEHYMLLMLLRFFLQKNKQRNESSIAIVRIWLVFLIVQFWQRKSLLSSFFRLNKTWDRGKLVVSIYKE